MDPETTSRWRGLRARVISGFVLAALVIFCTLHGTLSFYALLLVVALLMYGEWLELTKSSPLLNRFGGLVYVGLPVWSLIAIKTHGDTSYLISLFAIVAATDIGAYFGGKLWGKRKLAPSISPGKTLEGLACGMAAAIVAGGISAFFTHFSIPLAAIIGAALAVVAQMGDLFESYLKRKAGVKDSSTLIPGHGGILDRVDGLVFAAPVYALFVMV